MGTVQALPATIAMINQLHSTILMCPRVTGRSHAQALSARLLILSLLFALIHCAITTICMVITPPPQGYFHTRHLPFLLNHFAILCLVAGKTMEGTSDKEVE